MLALIVTNYVKEENITAFLEVSRAHAAKSLAIDAGCIRFDVCAPCGDEVMYIEIWEDEESLAKHAERGNTAIEIEQICNLRYDKKMDKRDII
ncbi:MAG TPA: antibiotic biosynthesis monooxygenase [Clostridia bacterium]|nr:antibiotic biosynthesis monooxygenase [Clostridia bacterium]